MLSHVFSAYITTVVIREFSLSIKAFSDESSYNFVIDKSN